MSPKKKRKATASLTIGHRAYESKRRMAVGDQHRPVFDWVFFVSGSATGLLKTVTITLHPTYSDPVMESNGPAFEFKRAGWGSSEIGVSLKWKTGVESSSVWFLDLNLPFSCTEIEVPDDAFLQDSDDVLLAERAAKCLAPPPDQQCKRNFEDCARAGYALVGKVLQLTYPEGTWLAKIVGFVENVGHHLVDTSEVSDDTYFTDLICIKDLYRQGRATFLQLNDVPTVRVVQSSPKRPDTCIFTCQMNRMIGSEKKKVEQALLTIFERANLSCAAIKKIFTRPKEERQGLVCAWAQADERKSSKVLAALILEVLSKNTTDKGSSDSSKSIGFLHYIGSSVPGVAFLLIEKICSYLRELGISVIYSAADISMLGAVHAHYRWGFEFATRREWIEQQCLRYNDETIVAFMRKSI